MPENPENRACGYSVLRFGDRVSLELVGSFKSPSDSTGLFKEFNVWGHTVTGKLVTLFGAYQSETKTNIPGFPTSRLEAFSGLVGGHYGNEKDVIAHTVDVEFENLTRWSGITGIIYNSISSEGKRNVELTVPASIPLAEKEGISASLIFHIDTKGLQERTIPTRVGKTP